MSNFKIIGTPNPEVGKEVFYKISILNLPSDLFPAQSTPFGNNPFAEQVKWSIYILEYGNWVLKEKNNKTGPTVNYTFTETSLRRKGIRIVARLGEQKATLDVKPQHSAERKIVKVELCDALGNLQKKPFAYNQTVLARVHCLNLNSCTVFVTLWEDDAPGPGHSEINKNNKTITKSGFIANGIAEVTFKLAPDFAKIADKQLAKGTKSEGKMHEYYVTAEVFRQETKSSNNIDVINPNNNKPAPQAQKTTSQKPAPPKTTLPAAKKGPSKKEEKGIAETVSGTLYDWGESVFKAIPQILPDPIEVVNSLAKVFMADKKEEKAGKKETCDNCDKDITLDQIKRICVDKKNNCLIEDDSMIKLALPYLNTYRKKVGINTCVRKAHFLAQIAQESKFYDLEEGFNYYWESLIATFGAFTSEEGKMKAKSWGRDIKDKETKGYKAVSKENQINIANWAYKDNNSNKNFASGDGYRYRGRGFKQITWKSNYKDLSDYFNKNMKINNEANVNWEENYSSLIDKPKDAIVSALAYWGKNNINPLANENSLKAVEKVTKKINSALKGLEERKFFFKNAVEFLKVNDCKKGLHTSSDNGTIVIVSGTDTKKEKDPRQEIYWVMYKTSVYRNLSLQNYKKLKASKNLPDADYTTYLSRDTHQTYSKKQGFFKHSDKRFGQYNEIPPGEYFLVPAVSGQTYKIYVIDSESKGASAGNGIDGVDGKRGGVALHQYCPRFSVGCFTFNSGKDIAPVTNFIKEIPDLKLNDDKPVRFIVEERKIVESAWDDPKKGTKKWTGI